MSRIVVPKAIRDRFAVKPGDDLEITIESDGIRLRPAAPASSLAEEAGILVCSSAVPAADLGDRGVFGRTKIPAELGAGWPLMHESIRVYCAVIPLSAEH